LSLSNTTLLSNQISMLSITLSSVLSSKIMRKNSP